MITCQACGTENPDGGGYCVQCARKLDAASQDRVVQLRAQHTATGIRWPAIIIALLVIIIVAVVVGLVLTHVILALMLPTGYALLHIS